VVAPADWEEVRLGEVLDYEQPTKYLVSSRDYVEGGRVPVLTAGKSFLLGHTDDLDGIYSDLPTIIFDDFTTATQWVDFDFKVKSSACKMLKAKRGTCDLRYVYERLRALNYRISDHKRHWISVFHTMEMRMPPLKEQEEIAEALSDADAAIESLECLIAKKRDVKQAAMQQLLTGRTRLPGFTGDWEEVEFSQLCTPRKARIDPRVSGGGDVCVELENIASGSGHLLGVTYTSNTSSLKTMFQSGDVLFGKLRAYLKKYLLADFAGVCSTEIWALEANKIHAIPEFLAQVVRMEDFIESASLSYGTHMPRSDWSIVSRLLVSVPSLREQEKIGEALRAMDDELEALTEQVSKLRMVKEGMMQDLLTGKVRLV